MKLYQVEISNVCNLTCVYCPHPQQKRKKGYMTSETFRKVVAVAKRCGQNLLYLHNFGEPLLHPQLAMFLRYASEQGVECSFFTNGLLASPQVLQQLYNSGLRRISISDHVAGSGQVVWQTIQQNGLSIRIDEIYTPTVRHNWAGQVDAIYCEHLCHAIQEPCIFAREDAFVILWNGDVAACCIDCEGVSVRCTVDDLLRQDYCFHAHRLCAHCDLMRGYEAL